MKKKLTKNQFKVAQKYWKKLQQLLNKFYHEINILEENMQKEIEINNIEFFMCDNEYVGIGNMDRTLKLYQRKELEQC